jgi:hypothetical protein
VNSCLLVQFQAADNGVVLTDIWKCPRRQKIRHVSSVEQGKYILVACDHVVYLHERTEQSYTLKGEAEYQAGHLYSSTSFADHAILAVDNRLVHMTLAPFAILNIRTLEEPLREQVLGLQTLNCS